MDDALAQGAWQIDPDTRLLLRLDQVRQAMRDGAWREVILEAEELLDESPHHPEALFLLGEALLEIGDWVLAREVYDHRVSLGGDPTPLAPALVGLALASFHLADLPAAIASAREAIRLEPGNAEAHHVLGLSLEQTPAHGSSRIQEALAELTAASHLDPVQFPLPISLKPPEWQEVIERAVAALPAKLQQFYADIPFELEELPKLEELHRPDPPLSPSRTVLADGTPPELGTEVEDLFEVRPPAIRLFTRNLGRAGTVDAIVSELTFSLREEALDWLGVELEDLEQMGD
jgi:tetratricopeptide (TPR) repeat protein